MDENVTFEQAFEDLTKAVEALEKGDKSLEETVKLYEEAVRLSAVCGNILNNAKLKITQIANKGAQNDLRSSES